VERALAKLPADRFGTAEGLVAALTTPGPALVASPERAVSPGIVVNRRLVIGVAIALLLSTTFAIAGWLRSNSSPSSSTPVMRVPITLTGTAILTPGCTSLVYSQNRVLQIRDLDKLTARPLPSTSGALQGSIFASPDGEWIGFFRGRDMHRIPITGGQPVLIAPGVGANPQMYGAAWGEDGYIYFVPDNGTGLYRVPASGGEPEVFTEPDPNRGEGGHRFPEPLPGGAGVLYTAWRGDPDSAAIVLKRSDAAEPIVIGRGTFARFSGRDHVVFARSDGSIHAVKIDPNTLEPLGSSVGVADSVVMTPYGAARFTMCQNGLFAYGRMEPNRVTAALVVVDPDGHEQVLAEGRFSGPELSPDGSAVATANHAGDETAIWVYPIGGTGYPIALEGANFGSVWSPDGEYVSFFSDRGGGFSLYRRKSDGSGGTEVVLERDGSQMQHHWSPDGKWLVFHEAPVDDPSRRDILLLSLDDARAPELLVTNAWLPRFSPDGRYVAYRVEPSQIWVIDLQDRESRFLVSSASDSAGIPIRWKPDGSELYFVDDGSLWSVPVEVTPRFRVLGQPSEVLSLENNAYRTLGSSYSVAPDGRFVFHKVRPPLEQLVLVTNWFEELERLMTGRAN
jgi:serine/threonine-protein kinase